MPVISPRVVRTQEVEFPPGSENIVGRVDEKCLLNSPPSHIYAYLGEKVIWDKVVHNIPFRNYDEKVDKVFAKAASVVQYHASLMFDLPRATEAP